MKTTKKAKKEFARRFSYDDWMNLSGNIEFLDALDRSIEEAEIVAHKILNSKL